MIESYAYELIEREGVMKGMLEEAREILEGLAERFKVVPKDLEDAIERIESRTVLKELHRATFRVRNLEGFRMILNKMISR